MREINNWNKIKKGQIIIKIYSDGSGILSPQIFCGVEKDYPLLKDFFDEFDKPCLANIPNTKFYKPDKWYWNFYQLHLLELKTAYSRYYEIEERLDNQYSKIHELLYKRKGVTDERN